MQTSQICPCSGLQASTSYTANNFMTGSLSMMSQMLGFMQQILSSQLGQVLGGQLGSFSPRTLPSFGGSAPAGLSSSTGSFLGNQASDGGASSVSTGASSTAPTGDPKKTSKATGTGYYPDNSAMEGGYVDRKGKKLQTLQDFLAGKADYVSVAMDKNQNIPYGTKLRIPELEKKYGRPIEFRVVDTGGAFTGKGNSRIDICTASKKDSEEATINGPLTLQFY